MATDTTGPAPTVNRFQITLPWGMRVSLYVDDGRPWLELVDEDDGAGASTALTPEALRLLVEHAGRMAGGIVVRDDDYARLIQYRRDTLGLICPQGHHTRFVDLLGDPNSDDYVCVHCAVRAGPADRDELVRVLDPQLDAPGMAAWERGDRLRAARYRADRLLAAGYRRLASESSGDGAAR